MALHWMAHVLHGGVDGSTPIGKHPNARDPDPSHPIGHPPRPLPLSGTGTSTGTSTGTGTGTGTGAWPNQGQTLDRFALELARIQAVVQAVLGQELGVLAVFGERAVVDD